jgi:hypothetical protein
MMSAEIFSTASARPISLAIWDGRGPGEAVDADGGAADASEHTGRATKQ